MTDRYEPEREFQTLREKAKAEKRAKAQKLAREGLTLSQISVRLGVSDSAVAEWLTRAGVPYRRANRDGVLGFLADGMP